MTVKVTYILQNKRGQGMFLKLVAHAYTAKIFLPKTQWLCPNYCFVMMTVTNTPHTVNGCLGDNYLAGSQNWPRECTDKQYRPLKNGIVHVLLPGLFMTHPLNKQIDSILSHYKDCEHFSYLIILKLGLFSR